MARYYTQEMMDSDVKNLQEYLTEEEVNDCIEHLQSKVGKVMEDGHNKEEKKEDIWDGWDEYLSSREKELRNNHYCDSYDNDDDDDIEYEIYELEPEWREAFLRHKGM